MSSELKCFWILGPVIIGAGPSGLAAAACLKQKGIPFLILEKESCLASLWKLKTYEHLRLHLPKKFCELPYMSFPQEVAVYPTKQHFIIYLEAYAKAFSIAPMFGQEVKSVTYDSYIGIWRIVTSEFIFVCRWLIVATGENAIPTIPDISGLRDFQGKLLHSSNYMNGEEFKGSKVLVVGCGNSGMELSLDLCNSGAQVSLVVRDKMHILPRDMLGTSTFALSIRLLKWFPLRLVDCFLILCSLLILGNTQRFGIIRPKAGPLELKKAAGRTPVLDVGTIAKIKTGKIKVVRNIQRFVPRGAEFAGGKMEEYESIILATGYRSNIASWLKVDLCQKDNYPKNLNPNSWKGEYGLYSVGFTGEGLFGASIDARRVAEDIASLWNAETKHVYSEPDLCVYN
ncbi:hypothetical protein ACH5RR_013778 [Cinchona calisaya]|uniref:indole-3-pyruvate monooxygenase n=1 Tax=Cinchona calisaya TaxID=153742 RepID=A0ABD3A104_9GENT